MGRRVDKETGGDALADEGLDFRIALAGENFRMQPAEFEEARARLGDRLVHYG